TPNGSGQMTVYIGTAESGIIQTSTNFFRGSNVSSNYLAPEILTGSNPMSIGNDTAPLRGATSSRNIPSSSIIDELVFVNDGYLDNERILHYALSGINYVEESD